MNNKQIEKKQSSLIQWSRGYHILLLLQVFNVVKKN